VAGAPAEEAAGGGGPGSGGAGARQSESGLSRVLDDRHPSSSSEGSPAGEWTPVAVGREAGRNGELRVTERSGDPRASEAGGDFFNAELDRALTSIRKTSEARRSASRRSITGSTSAVAMFVNSTSFTVALGSLIIISAILIGVETHVFSTISYQSSDSPAVKMVFSTLNYIVTFLFTVELGLRLYVYRIDFFVTERWWNCFDLIILLMALAEVALELVVMFAGANQTLFDNGGTAKMMRLIRLTRLLRLVRTFRQLKPLRMLVRSIMAAGRSVFWALLLLIMIIFAFGVILTQAVTEHTAGGTRLDDEDLVSYYGDLYRSMVSLWMAVSGGISWIELTRPLERTGNSLWMVMFLVYILIVYFFILNVVTGVFCQNAIEGAAADLDLTLEAQIREKQIHVERLALLFHELNEGTEDRDMELSHDELQFLLAKPKVQSWFRSLDIDARETWKLFKIIDADDSGSVSIQEFVEGCLQLRGPATRVDVESLKWEIRQAEKRTELMSRQATLQDAERNTMALSEMSTALPRESSVVVSTERNGSSRHAVRI
jgi:voltage-gated sodium channel